MSWSLKPAVQEDLPLFLGIAGPSSSGKTYSALRIATGMQSVVGGTIGVIDTENRRALHYANKFKFQHLPFEAPFSSLRYLEAIQYVVAQGCNIVVVDSASHEHDASGGYLATHDAEMTRMAGSDYAKRERVKFSAWIRPAADRRMFLNGLQQTRAHFVFCFRAKERLSLVKDAQGKVQPVEMGWQAIAGQEIVYDMTALAVLPPRSNGVPDWTAEATKLTEDLPALFPPKGQPLDEATGKRLAEWAKGTAPPPVAKPQRKLSDVLAGIKAMTPEEAKQWEIDQADFLAKLHATKPEMAAQVRDALMERLPKEQP